MATADRMRIVEFRNTVPFPVLDLLDGATYNHVKGSFQTARPAKTRAMVPGGGRYDGDRVAFEKMGNGSITAQWMIGPLGAGADASHANVEKLAQAFEDATHSGRMIEVRFAGTTRSVFYEPRGTPDWSLASYDPQQTNANSVLQATFTIPVGPLCLGAQMVVEDHFLTDTVADGDYIKDGAGTMTVVGTKLVPGGIGAGNLLRYRHARGYPYQDVELRLNVKTGATIASGRYGIFMSANQTGVDTKLAFELDQVAGQAQLVRYLAGVRTVIGSTLLTITASTTYYMRMRREGDRVYVSVQNDPVQPDVPTWAWSDYQWNGPTANYALAGADLGFQDGDCGICIVPADTAERYDDFHIRPFSYYQVATPEVLRLGGGIPGAAPALADVEITTNDTGAIGQPPVWADLAWSERPLVCNLVRNGDFENAPGSGGDGWAHTALTNYVNTAATSHLRDAGVGRYGACSLQIITPANIQSGAWYQINRRLKADRQYAAFAWVTAAAGTTSVALKLGANGLGGATTGTAKALSTAWQLLAVTYRATADFDAMIVGVATQAATATTFNLDGVVVVEVPTITLQAAIASTTATSFPVYATPPETPNLRPDGTLNGPFLVAIDSELIRVTAINATTNAWTCERGVEGTTAATHAVDTPVIIAPPLLPHLEGRGAAPAFGIIEGEAYEAPISAINLGTGTLAVTAATTGRGQQTLNHVSTSAISQAATYFYIDPNTVVPDDFTAGEVEVEVFARIGVPTLANSAATLLAQVEPSERFNGLVLAGRKRYSREFSSVTRQPIAPLTTNNLYRLTRIGTFPMVVDRLNPQRWRLRLLTQLAVSGFTFLVDYLMVAPVRYRACLPTGKVDDSGSTYPSFIPFDLNWGTGTAMTKIFRADGSALIRNPIPATGRPNTLPPTFPDHGFVKPIALPTGDVDLYMKLSDTIPDDPTSNTKADMSGGASASWVSTIRVMPTPRYFVGRGGF